MSRRYCCSLLLYCVSFSYQCCHFSYCYRCFFIIPINNIIFFLLYYFICHFKFIALQATLPSILCSPSGSCPKPCAPFSGPPRRERDLAWSRDCCNVASEFLASPSLSDWRPSNYSYFYPTDQYLQRAFIFLQSKIERRRLRDNLTRDHRSAFLDFYSFRTWFSACGGSYQAFCSWAGSLATPCGLAATEASASISWLYPAFFESNCEAWKNSTEAALHALFFTTTMAAHWCRPSEAFPTGIPGSSESYSCSHWVRSCSAARAC